MSVSLFARIRLDRRTDDIPRSKKMVGTRGQSAPSEVSVSTLAASAHSLDAGEVALLLQVDAERGLDTHDTLARRETFGPNALQAVKPRPVWRILLGQFKSIVVALLGVAALVSLAAGD